MYNRVLIVSIVVYVSSLTQAKFDGIDYSICNPLTASTPVPPPPPEFAPEFSSRIEWKWMETNSTVDIVETHDTILQKGSQIMFIEGEKIYVIYDYKEKEYITYTESDGCKIRGLESFEFYDNKMWLSAIKGTYGMARKANPAYNGTENVRSTFTSKWVSCLYLYQFNITVEVEMYFSANGWAMPLSAPNTFTPVRFVLRGSTVYNDTAAGKKPFTVIGDFVEFNPQPPDDSLTQLPAGTFCPGRFSRVPLNVVPKSFSLVSEVIDSRRDQTYVTYESIWFDSDKKLVRRDYKRADGNDPDPTSEVFDFNLGIHYHIDSYMGSCDPISPLDLGDLFVAPGPDSTIRMMTSKEYFHSGNATIHYVGTRTTRGVECDVWVGIYVDPDANRNFTIEWYFTKDNVIEGVGGIIEPAALFRYDIWQGNGKPIVRNILQFNTESPKQDVFDVSQCFPFTYKARLLIFFSVVNNGDLSTVSTSYLKDLLHITIVTKAMLPPLRISGVSVEFVGKTDVYLDAFLLDKSPVTNNNILPPPPPQHSLEAAFGFLKGVVGGKWNISLSSTTGKMPVIIESRGILRINYTQSFTTTPTTTARTTTEATPPPPAPTTVMPITPTREKTPPSLPPIMPTNSKTACTCPAHTCPPTQKVSILPSTCPKCLQTTCQPCSTCTPDPKCPTITSPACICPVKTCPPKVCPQQNMTCPICPTCQQCPRSQATPKCPIQTTPMPCPTLHTTLPATEKHLQQQGNPSMSTSGVSKGATAGVAIAMLLFGVIIGFGLLIMYRRLRAKYSSPDRRNILDKYLDTDDKY